MSIKLSTSLLCGSIAGAALALGAALSAGAQPYSDSDAYMKTYGHMPYAASDASDYATDTSATVGGVTVYAPPRGERSPIGAPIQTVRVSRIVPIDDLDLSTREGVHELHNRVERAAYDACDELDRMPGMIPQDSTSDCQHDAVHRAMDNAPISYRDADDAY
jgi:UrcA family protein